MGSLQDRERDSGVVRLDACQDGDVVKIAWIAYRNIQDALPLPYEVGDIGVMCDGQLWLDGLFDWLPPRRMPQFNNVKKSIHVRMIQWPRKP